MIPDGPDHLPVAYDAQAALARVGSNRRLLGELAGLFLEDSARWLAEIAASLERGNAAGAQFTAHQLRGSAASLGAHAACRAARDLEEAARAGDVRRAASLVSDLETCLRRLRPALADLARAAAEARA